MPIESGEARPNAPHAAPVRVGIVGLGAVVERYHAPALEETARMGLTRVTQLLDPDPSRMAMMHARFPDAAAAQSVDALAPNVDLAIVATPVRLHLEQVGALLRHGAHVLCEKPMARTVEDAERMLEAAGETGHLLAIGMNRRFFPAVEAIGDLVRSGALGRVTGFHLDEGGRFGWPAVTASFFDRAQSGGGVTMDIGVHMFDIAMHWFGDVESFDYADDAYGGVEVNARGALCFPGGVKGTFQLSWDVPLSGTYAIQCERGWIRWATNAADGVVVSIDGIRHAFAARLAEPAPRRARGLGAAAGGYLASFTAQLVDLVAAIRGDHEPRVNGASGLRAVRLVRRMYDERQILVPGYFTEAEAARARALARDGT